MRGKGGISKNNRFGRDAPAQLLRVIVSQRPGIEMQREKEPERPDELRELARRCRIIAAVVDEPDKSRILAVADDLERLASAATSQFNWPPAPNRHTTRTEMDIRIEENLIREVAQLGYEIVKEGALTVAQKGLFRRYIYSREDLLLLVEQAKGQGEQATQ
jgi:hypothetical protein